MLCVLLLSEWIMEHWDVLRWPLLLAILISVGVGRKRSNAEGGLRNFAELADRYPLIKVWLAVYGLALAAGGGWVIYQSYNLLDHLGVGVVLLLFVFLLAPFLVAQQIDRYRELGGQSNKKIQATQKSRA